MKYDVGALVRSLPVREERVQNASISTNEVKAGLISTERARIDEVKRHFQKAGIVLNGRLPNGHHHNLFAEGNISSASKRDAASRVGGLPVPESRREQLAPSVNRSTIKQEDWHSTIQCRTKTTMTETNARQSEVQQKHPRLELDTHPLRQQREHQQQTDSWALTLPVLREWKDMMDQERSMHVQREEEKRKLSTRLVQQSNCAFSQYIEKLQNDVDGTSTWARNPIVGTDQKTDNDGQDELFRQKGEEQRKFNKRLVADTATKAATIAADVARIKAERDKKAKEKAKTAKAVALKAEKASAEAAEAGPREVEAGIGRADGIPDDIYRGALRGPGYCSRPATMGEEKGGSPSLSAASPVNMPPGSEDGPSSLIRLPRGRHRFAVEAIDRTPIAAEEEGGGTGGITHPHAATACTETIDTASQTSKSSPTPIPGSIDPSQLRVCGVQAPYLDSGVEGLRGREHGAVNGVESIEKEEVGEMEWVEVDGVGLGDGEWTEVGVEVGEGDEMGMGRGMGMGKMVTVGLWEY